MRNLMHRVEFYMKIDKETRSSDKLLLWKCAFGDKQEITFRDFMNAPTFESVTRARRKIQEQHPELRAVKEVEEQRNINAIKMQAWSLRDKQNVLF